MSTERIKCGFCDHWHTRDVRRRGYCPACKAWLKSQKRFRVVQTPFAFSPERARRIAALAALAEQRLPLFAGPRRREVMS